MDIGATPSMLTPLIAVSTLPVAILTTIFYGITTGFVVLGVGWLVLTPASAILFEDPGPS